MIRVVVVYTSEVTKVSEGLDDLKISSKASLLSEYNGDAIMD